MTRYAEEIERQMQRYYQTLSEKDRRRYAAIEAVKFGYGGRGYICELLGCDYKTLAKGIEELQDENLSLQTKIRKVGGGAKPATEKYPGLTEAFLRVIDKHTAGSPMDEQLKWTNMAYREIVQKLVEQGFEVSVRVVRNLLIKHNFHKRKALKTKAGRPSPQRDEQFKKIALLKAAYKESGNPILSMDTKKKSQ